MKKIKLWKVATGLFIPIIMVMMLALTGCECGAETDEASGELEVPVDAKGADGETDGVSGELEVPVNAEGAEGVGSLEFFLAYDSAVLEATGVEKGTLASNAMMEFSIETPGQVWVGMVDANGMSGDDSLVIISFRVIGEDGISTPLTLENVDAYDAATLIDLLTQTSEGSFIGKDRSFVAPVINFGE
jgi:hypothetical protein